MLKAAANVAQRTTVVGLLGLTGFGLWTIGGQVNDLRRQAREYAEKHPEDNVLDISKMKR